MKFADPRPIKDYCLGIYDGPHATPKEAGDGPVFLGIKNITDDGALDLSEIRHVSEEEYPRWTRRVTPQAGDVVFTYEATLHRYAIIPDGFRGCLGRRVALVRPDPAQVDSRYLLYYFLSRGWRQVIESNVITGATVDRVPVEKFPLFPAALPWLRIQQQIADILSAYDDLIENNRRRMALLEDAARQLYREWFVRFRFPGHEHTPLTSGLPQGWAKSTLSSVCLPDIGIQTGPFGSQLHQAEYAETGVPVVMPKGMINLRIDTSSIARVPEEVAERLSRHRMQEGDVAYGRRGDIGRRAFIGKRQTGWLCGTGSLRLRPDPHRISARYFFDALGSPQTFGTIASRAKGATLPNLNATVMETVPLLLPPRALQDIYTETVQPMADQVEILSEQNEKLRAARELLLPRLMSGEIAV